MHIGLDFDNTIVSYDELFHMVAMEGGWITADVPVSKVSVRDYLRRIGREEVWTEMQGYVYGGRMAGASAYPGLVDALKWARNAGIALSIVSHKTRHPFVGHQYDLHQAAREWILLYLKDEDGPFIPMDRVYFELTKEAKVQRIADIRCDLYVDDLPEILLAPGFPQSTRKLLFDPDQHHAAQQLPRAVHWAQVRDCIDQQWKQTS